MRDLQQPAVQSPGTDLVAFAFLGAAAAVAGVQAGFLLHDARGWSEVEAGSIASWHHIPYLESLLALVDLAVLAVAALVLLATFAERHRRPAWAALAWVLIALAASSSGACSACRSTSPAGTRRSTSAPTTPGARTRPWARRCCASVP